jgi:3-oxoadipate enol-lactonase
MFMATPAMGYVECCGVLERMDLEPDLPAIRAPALVLGARPDPATPPAHHEKIAAAIPGARLVLLDDGAHLVNVERADEVTGLIVEHLALGPREERA